MSYVQGFVTAVPADARETYRKFAERGAKLFREFGATRIVEDFPVRQPDLFDEAALESILAFNPEVVLLGTGARAVFPPQAVLAQFLKRGIGLETMDSAAAARTFNVLAGEGRNVVALFLLPN